MNPRGFQRGKAWGALTVLPLMERMELLPQIIGHLRLLAFTLGSRPLPGKPPPLRPRALPDPLALAHTGSHPLDTHCLR